MIFGGGIHTKIKEKYEHIIKWEKFLDIHLPVG